MPSERGTERSDMTHMIICVDSGMSEVPKRVVGPNRLAGSHDSKIIPAAHNTCTMWTAKNLTRPAINQQCSHHTI